MVSDILYNYIYIYRQVLFHYSEQVKTESERMLFVTSSIQSHLFFHLHVFIINLVKHAEMQWKGNLNNVSRFMC